MEIKENVERKFCSLHQLVQSHHNPATLRAPFSSSSHQSMLHILGWYVAPTWLECRIYLHKKVDTQIFHTSIHYLEKTC